jgi:bleomycin hydrolase
MVNKEKYKNKYLKYKKKYLKYKKNNIKDKMNGGTNSITIDPELWKNITIDEKDLITLHNNSLYKLLIPSNINIENHHIFNKKIKNLNKISNQKSSGRCWMFAGLNMIRNKFIEKYNLENDFEFSQSYLFFWDKFERMNYIIYLLEDLYKKGESYNSRIVENIIINLIDDGGTWSMFQNLIKKYGLIPKSVFAESYHTSNSGNINEILKKKLKEYLRDIYNEKMNKEQALKDIYLLLVKFFGKPPSQFNWEYVDKKCKYKIVKNLTVEKFTKMIKIDLNEYICLIHDPRHKYDSIYGVEYLNNMIEGEEIKYLNVDINIIKTAAKKSIDKNESVYFACDVGKFLLNKNNILDTEIYKIEDLLHIDFNLDKKERLLYYETQPTHAMVITGYNINDSVINRWQIENSWGEGKNKEEDKSNGYYSMTDKWLEEYVFEIIVNKKYLSNDLKKKWNENIQERFPIWDPFGTLA